MREVALHFVLKEKEREKGGKSAVDFGGVFRFCVY